MDYLGPIKCDKKIFLFLNILSYILSRLLVYHVYP